MGDRLVPLFDCIGLISNTMFGQLTHLNGIIDKMRTYLSSYPKYSRQ